MKLNEFDDVSYYREEIEKAGLPVSKLGAKLKIRGEDGESKWLNINSDSIKALNNWFNKKNTNNKDKTMKTDKTKKVIKESYGDANFFDFIEQDAGMRHEALEYMKGYMDAETLLTELIHALDDDAALDNLGYIARMNDIPKPDDLNESVDKKKVTPKKILKKEETVEELDESVNENTITMDQFYTNMLK